MLTMDELRDQGAERSCAERVGQENQNKRTTDGSAGGGEAGRLLAGSKERQKGASVAQTPLYQVMSRQALPEQVQLGVRLSSVDYSRLRLQMRVCEDETTKISKGQRHETSELDGRCSFADEIWIEFPA